MDQNVNMASKKTLSSKNLVDLFPDRNECIYTKCYCEENVWKLCELVRNEHLEYLEQCFAVFISNSNKTVPVWKQKASSSPSLPVVWDYHVILVMKGTDDNHVFDLDTILPFPCPFTVYAGQAIQPDSLLKEQFHRCFRVIPASTFLDTFSSDRSHMLKPDKTWMATPPNYPCIQTQDNSNNLQEFIDMTSGLDVGEVMTSETFIDTFGQYEAVIQEYMDYVKHMRQQAIADSKTIDTQNAENT